MGFDVTTRNAKEVIALEKRIVKYLKSVNGRMGTIETAVRKEAGKEIFTVYLENNMQIAHEMSYIVNKSKYAILVDYREIPGEYMWSADTYIKDTSVVEYTF